MDIIELNKNLFPEARLRDGKSYYKKGHVTSLRRVGGSFTAQVKGNAKSAYRVFLLLDPSGMAKSFACSCPYAGQGHLCKHEAALLYAANDLITRSVESGASGNKTKTPFVDSSDPVHDFKTYLSNASRFNARAYLMLAEDLVEHYGPKLSHQDLLSCELEIIKEAHLHGGFSIPKELAALGTSFVEALEHDEAVSFIYQLLPAFPSFDAKAYFLAGKGDKEPYISALEALIESNLLQGKEINMVFAANPDDPFFSCLSPASLTSLGNVAFLERPSSEAFIRACIATGNDQAIMALLNRGQLTLQGEIANEVRDYFRNSGKIERYIEFMHSSIQGKRESLRSIIDYYHSLPEEYKKDEGFYLRKTLAYTSSTPDINVLTQSGSLTSTEFMKLSYETIAYCDKEIQEFGERFYEKPLIRRLESAARQIEKGGVSESTVATIFVILERYLFLPSVASFATNPSFVQASLSRPGVRKYYLRLESIKSGVTGLGRF